MWIEATVAYASASLFASVAAWVLLTRPGDRVNRVLAAVLVLMAGDALAFFYYRTALTTGQAYQFIQLLDWYNLPTVPLIVMLLDALFAARPRPRKWTLALWASGIAVGLLLAVHAAQPGLFHDPARATDLATFGRILIPPEPLAAWAGELVRFTQVLAIAVAASAARDHRRAVLQRRQAAFVAVAFMLPALHAEVGPWIQAGMTTALGRGALPSVSALAVSGLALGVIAWAWVTVASPFRPGSARFVRVVAALPLIGALVDGLPGYVLGTDLLDTRPVWLTALALTLGVAVIRYGLGGVTVRAPWQAGRLAGRIASLGAAGAIAGLALYTWGGTPSGLVGASVALALPVAMFVWPPPGLERRLAARLLLDPSTVEVQQERTRIYRSAAVALREQEGTTLRAGHPVLAALRDELGLVESDHEAILEGAEPTNREPPRRLFVGRYLVERELGRGGTAVAYFAWDTMLGRPVVVKRLVGLATTAHTLAAEARALMEAQSPHVAALHGVHQSGTELLLVLEYLPGGTLADLVAAGPVPAARARAIMRDVLAGLADLHERGIVHGDVKPSNVLLTAAGRAKVADLGTARWTSVQGSPARPQTRPLGAQMATPAFLAPERLAGGGATEAADVFGAGAVLLFLLTGRTDAHLFAAGSEAATPATHGSVHDRVPSDLRRVLATALAVDPRERYARVAAMAQGLEAARRTADADAADG